MQNATHNTTERGIADERKMNNKTNEKASSLRWKILRQALLSNSSPSNSGNFILTFYITSIQSSFHAPNYLQTTNLKRVSNAFREEQLMDST
jgi:hypothetical protein